MPFKWSQTLRSIFVRVDRNENMLDLRASFADLFFQSRDDRCDFLDALIRMESELRRQQHCLRAKVHRHYSPDLLPARLGLQEGAQFSWFVRIDAFAHEQPF